MRRPTYFLLIAAISVAALDASGCVDGFRGANVQLDLSPGVPVQANVGGAVTAGDLPAASHFALYAIQQDAATDRLFEVQRFEIHRIVDPSSPCFIDAGDNVPHRGLHVTQFANKIAQDIGATGLTPPPGATEQEKTLLATAIQRMTNVAALAGPAGIKVIASASPATYPAVAASCDAPAGQIPPPTCTDDASNQRRLELCQAAWRADGNLFEGTDRVLTSPLNGETHGMVDGLNPINMAPVGGAQFFVPSALADIDAYAIYTQVDGVDAPGTQLFFGRPEAPTRGVLHVHMVSPINSLLTAELAVFSELGHDDVHF